MYVYTFFLSTTYMEWLNDRVRYGWCNSWVYKCMYVCLIIVWLLKYIYIYLSIKIFILWLGLYIKLLWFNVKHFCLYSGFWEAYEVVRDFIHLTLRRELSRSPTSVYFTGHSLGGALATFAALDVTIHTLPRVNAYLKFKAQ